MDKMPRHDDEPVPQGEPGEPERPAVSARNDRDEPTDAPASDERTPEEAGYGYGV